MSIIVAFCMALLAACLVLGSLLHRAWKDLQGVRRDLAGTRTDLVRQLRETEQFRMAIENASDGITVQRMDGRIVWANPAYCRIMGRSASSIVGRNPLEFAMPPDQTPTAAEIAAFRFDPRDPRFRGLQLYRNMRRDGTLFWIQISLSFRKSATGEEHVILICRDVTEQIEQEERLREARNRLEHEAAHDALTGIANRSELIRFARAALGAAHDAGTMVGILHVDLDKFKEINDTHGHSAGDETLIHVAGALAAGVRRGDLVARIGGDEFVVICPGMTCLTDLETIATALARAIAKPFEWGDRNLTCHASIGAALSEPAERDPEGLMLRSDFALYEAKRRGRDRVAAYDGDLYERHSLQMRRSAELADVIDAGALDHHFQPTMDLVSGRIVGFETLVRWQHPAEGLIAPADFLPMAAELGMMGEVDLGSMSRALAMKHRLAACGHPDVTLAFNASVELLTHPEFIRRLVWGVESMGLCRNQIVIEVLETTVFGAPSANSSQAAVIRDLRDAGFQVLLDDFGIGYAGLAHLAQLAVTGVKIDRSLIGNILSDDTSARIVATIVALCADLGLGVIAEGVEDVETAAHLRRIGCTHIQGYWIARPMPVDDALQWLDSREAAPRNIAVAG